MNSLLKTNLKKLMIKHGHMSVSDLAKATNLPQPTLHQLYTGTTKKPRRKTLSILAQYFSVTPHQLLGEEGLPEHLPEKTKIQLELNTAPLLSWDDLHLWPNHINLDHKKEIFLDKKASKTTFAVTMPDASMEPLFPNGCLLIFDPEKTTQDKDCAIIFLKKTNQFCFKKIITHGELTYAQSLNPEKGKEKATILAADDKILATLLEARLMF